MSAETKPSTRKKSRVKKITGVIAIVLIVMVLTSLTAIPFIIMPMFLGQRFEQQQFHSDDYGIASERITLLTDDGLSIAAWRTKSDAPKGTVIILSGIQNPSVTAFFGYAKMFSDNGWDALLIEMRARSESEGDEIGLGMTEWLDVKAGVDYLTADENVKELPIVALGTSMGASTVIIAAGEAPEIDAVISISAFSSWTNMFVAQMSMSGIPRAFSVLEKPFVSLYTGLHYGFDALQYSPVNGIAKLGERPILLMHSTGDSQVPYSEFEILLDTAQKNHVDATTFIREGDEHFICLDPYFENPEKDIDFSCAIFDFLNANFQ